MRFIAAIALTCVARSADGLTRYPNENAQLYPFSGLEGADVPAFDMLGSAQDWAGQPLQPAMHWMLAPEPVSLPVARDDSTAVSDRSRLRGPSSHPAAYDEPQSSLVSPSNTNIMEFLDRIGSAAAMEAQTDVSFSPEAIAALSDSLASGLAAIGRFFDGAGEWLGRMGEAYDRKVKELAPLISELQDIPML